MTVAEPTDTTRSGATSSPPSNTSPIGIFDSGVGGLTVARAVAAELPFEPFIYLGDTARVPYGNKSPNTVARYSENIVALLCQHGAKAIVIACNTASAFASEHLAARFDVPVIDVIGPVAARAAEVTRNGRVGVIGTRGTVKSGAYHRALIRHDDHIDVTQVPCPLFVPLAEENWTEGPIADAVAREYLGAFTGSDIDTLILGCTHYPLLRDTIQRTVTDAVGHDVTVLDSAVATADRLTTILDDRDLRAKAGTPTRRFWMTDSSDTYVSACVTFFGAPVHQIEHVDVGS